VRIELDYPGHAGSIGVRLADGSLHPDPDGRLEATAYRAMCSCGWVGPEDRPPAAEGRMMATSDWHAHMKPVFASVPPDWMLNRSEGLRDAIAELKDRWPLQSLAVLASVDRWHRTLLDETVVAAREKGASWLEIGNALGITKQSAHERFKKKTS
jgi:hypothetical protein